MRCYRCAPHRTARAHEAGTARPQAPQDDAMSSTGSGAAAGTARRDDDARIAELTEVLSAFTEQIAALRRDLSQLRSEFLNLQAKVNRWDEW